MARRGDNIHKRKDGRWEGRYRTKNEAMGKTKYYSVYGHSYREVKTKLLEIRSAPEDFQNPIVQSKTFEEVLMMWRDSEKANHKMATEAKYDYLAQKHILPELGGIKISDITNEQINEFVNGKALSGRLDGDGGLSSSYIRTIMVIVKSVIKYAADKNLCPPFNIKSTRSPVDKKNIAILSAKEQQLLERSLLCDMDITKLGIYISLNTGLRIGEICSLSWDDIDLEERILHVRSTIARVNVFNESKKQSTLIIDRPKTKASYRDIPISSKLYPALKKMRKKATSSFVVSNGNSFTSPRTYDYRYHKVLGDCNINAINYHALRHTFATRCIESGMDVKTLSEILGHINVSTTLNTYVHSSMELKRMQIEKLSLF